MNALYLIHEDSRTIKVSFFTIVIRTAAIAAKYPGGLNPFAAKFKPRFNNDLAVLCAMSGNELGPLIQNLQQHGFDRGDAVFFDAASYVIAGEYGEIDFGVPWLTAVCTNDGFFVSYTDEQERNQQ